MHVILATMGTAGDVLPFIGLGNELVKRGHRATLAGPERYEPTALACGLGFRSLVSFADDEACLSSPDLWHPIKSGLHAARWGLRLIPNQFDALKELCDSKDAVLVSHIGLLAARCIQDKTRTPLASLMLQPGLLQSIYQPPVMPFAPIPNWLPYSLRKVYWQLIDLVGRRLVGKPLNRFRALHGLPPIKRFFKWWISPDLVIATFPKWYAEPQVDWPKQLQQVGFLQFDGLTEPLLDNELISFCTDSEPPIAFTLGSGMKHAADFFQTAMKTTEIMGRRGIFLTQFRESLPDSLPANIRHVTYAPFRQLFPLCSAIVHHGGIGTTARALASGRPQLILPLAWDQPDNAARVERLQAGMSLDLRHRNAQSVADALTKLLMPESLANCNELSNRIQQEDSLSTAAELVEEFYNRSTATR